jgi:hypothetical protein
MAILNESGRKDFRKRIYCAGQYKEKEKTKTHMQAGNIVKVRDLEGGNWGKLLRKLETANP